MKGMIEWFARNSVAANLMMAFTNTNEDRINVEVPYLGAAPEEVEQAVNVRIEEAIQGIDGLHPISFLGAIALMPAARLLPRARGRAPLAVPDGVDRRRHHDRDRRPGAVGSARLPLLLDLHVSKMSMFGLVALTGVVVNDSLIMVDFVNARDVRTR